MTVKLIPAFIWAFIVAILCLLPQSIFYNPGFFEKIPLDKIAHFGMFFILSFLVWRGMKSKLLGKINIHILFILLLLISYGGITELAQDWLTKTRHSEILDFLIDIVGVFLGFLAYLVMVKRKTSDEKELAKY